MVKDQAGFLRLGKNTLVGHGVSYMLWLHMSRKYLQASLSIAILNFLKYEMQLLLLNQWKPRPVKQLKENGIYWCGHKVHPSHLIQYHAGHIFCEICARYAKDRISKLKEPCPRKLGNSAGPYHIDKILREPSTEVPPSIALYLNEQLVVKMPTSCVQDIGCMV